MINEITLVFIIGHDDRGESFCSMGFCYWEGLSLHICVEEHIHICVHACVGEKAEAINHGFLSFLLGLELTN